MDDVGLDAAQLRKNAVRIFLCASREIKHVVPGAKLLLEIFRAPGSASPPILVNDRDPHQLCFGASSEYGLREAGNAPRTASAANCIRALSTIRD